jgi:hypothetical protein
MPNQAGGTDFLIVEAKGPGANLTSSVFVPPNYSQMEQGWVTNHLHSMNNNKHPAGVSIVNALRLQFEIEHKGYNGASKNYWGLAAASGHKGSASRVYGTVVHARWLSDGRLSYNPDAWVQYFT